MPDENGQKHISGAWRRIIFAGVLSVGTMVALTALLTWLVFNHFIAVPKVDKYSSADYLFMHNIASGIPLLLTSLSAILSFVLIAAVNELASVIHARNLIFASEQQDVNRMPSVYDFALVVSMLSGGFGSYLRSVKQCMKPGKHTMLNQAVLLASIPLSARSVTLANLLTLQCQPDSQSASY